MTDAQAWVKITEYVCGTVGGIALLIAVVYDVRLHFREGK